MPLESFQWPTSIEELVEHSVGLCKYYEASPFVACVMRRGLSAGKDCVGFGVVNIESGARAGIEEDKGRLSGSCGSA